MRRCLFRKEKHLWMTDLWVLKSPVSLVKDANIWYSFVFSSNTPIQNRHTCSWRYQHYKTVLTSINRDLMSGHSFSEIFLLVSASDICRGQFECRTGQCIDKNFVCDGYPQCPDNSDEAGCTGHHHHHGIPIWLILIFVIIAVALFVLFLVTMALACLKYACHRGYTRVWMCDDRQWQKTFDLIMTFTDILFHFVFILESKVILLYYIFLQIPLEWTDNNYITISF